MRKIDDNLIGRMTKGDLSLLLDYVKSDNELRLEVRQSGDAFIYYRKGKALEVKKLKVNKKYENVPDTKLAITNPKEYFALIKKAIDDWLNKKKKRAEFDTQQNIAKSNQEKEDKYIILDMEYAFKQRQIERNKREKDKTAFDLIGVDRETNRIVFFEVKTGMRATKGKSGIKDHIDKFEKYFSGENSAGFMENLIADIKNIIEDKTRLGIIDNFYFSEDLKLQMPEFVFVFHPNDEAEIKQFEAELNNQYKLIVVSDNNYKLN